METEKMNDELTPDDVIKMPLAEFKERFGFLPDDKEEKKWFAVTAKRLSSINRDAIEAGIVGETDLSSVVFE